ncbi:MAG: metal ABC transporter solute-binding protein, Zn/Mn family [Desulfovibrio sp.]
MKKMYIVLLTIIMSMAVGSVASANPLKVAVSIVPQKYFVEEIGGERVDVTVMVPPSGSPATYEPRPSQMARLTKSQLYFSIGVPFERTWLPRMMNANPNLTLVDVSKGITKIPMAAHVHEIDKDDDHGHGHGHGHEAEADDHKDGILDPHIWLSPQLVLTIADNIYTALVAADPAGKSEYQKGYEQFRIKVQTLSANIAQQAKQVKKRAFMVYHPSWGYLADQYGLEQIPVELEGKEPGMRELAHIINVAKEEGITAIFVQPQFSRKQAEVIAQSIDAKVIVADPLAYEWEKNLQHVAKMFFQN